MGRERGKKEDGRGCEHAVNWTEPRITYEMGLWAYLWATIMIILID